MSDRVSMLPPFVSTRTSVQVLGGLFFLTAAVSWTAVGVEFAEFRMASVAGAGELVERDTRLAHDTTHELVRAGQLACALGTAIGFLVWLHRARVNVRALGARKLRYRREWTVVGFLVPVLNLVRPYQVVREIWQASDPATADPLAWRSVTPPRLLSWWWGSFVAWLVLALGAGFVLEIARGHTQAQLAHILGMAADACAAVSASLAYFVVVRISEAQEQKRESPTPALARPELPFDPRDAVA